jgi:integrase
MNKKTTCITDEQFDTIVSILFNGNDKIKKNKEMAIMLTITGNCGLRIGDCAKLTMDSFVKEGNDYYYNIKEEKTGKTRSTIIPRPIYDMLVAYAIGSGKSTNEPIFDVKIRTLQYKLQQISKYLGDGYENISTHSFRKCAGMRMYRQSGNDIEMTRRFLNHSSINTTQKYLRVDEEDINTILKDNYRIPFKEVI